jgi:tripartite-type tricarboxylate transporter receptor subunit TctC
VNSIHRIRTAFAGVVGVVGILAHAGATPASAELNLHGKTVTLLVGNGLGGGGDTYARTFAPHFTKYLPGMPVIVVKNMSGGGGLQAVQYLYNVAASDGTYMGTNPAGPFREPFIGSRKVNYDLRKFHWIGSLGSEVTTCVVWHTSKATGLDYAMSNQVTLSSTGPTSNANIIPMLTNEYVGSKFKTILGYDGGTSLLAMERGEVEGRCLSIGALRAARPEWLEKKLIRPILTTKKNDDPFFRNAPVVIDAIKDPLNKQALLFFSSPDDIQYPYALPPNASAEAVQAYRAGFAKAVRDPAYLADAKRRHMDIEPHSGEAVHKVMDALYATPPEVVERVARVTKQFARKKSKKKKKAAE